MVLEPEASCASYRKQGNSFLLKAIFKHCSYTLSLTLSFRAKKKKKKTFSFKSSSTDTSTNSNQCCYDCYEIWRNVLFVRFFSRSWISEVVMGKIYQEKWTVNIHVPDNPRIMYLRFFILHNKTSENPCAEDH